MELEGKSGSERALRKMEQEDLQVASSLRRFVQVAEKSAQRAKVLYPLRRRARKLFGIVALGLEQHSLSSPIGKECNSLLRSHLLLVDRYCSTINSVLKQRLLVLYLKWLRQENYAKHKEDFHRNIDTLRLILLKLPGDICKVVRLEMCSVFGSAIKFLDNHSKIGFSFFRALNAFLFKHGLDSSSKMSTLSPVIYKFIRSTWEKSRHKGYRVAVCQFVQLELLLNVQGEKNLILSDLLECISNDLKNAESDLFLADLCHTRQYVQTAALVAGIVLSFNPPEPKCSSQKASKRHKCGAWEEKLWDDAMCSPEKWGPTIGVLLEFHASRISFSMLEKWLRILHSKLCDVESSLLSGKSNSGLLWLLRIVNHLSIAFWENSCADAPPWGLSCKIVEIWNEIYTKIARWISGSLANASLESEALMILSNISLIGHVPCHFIDNLVHAKVWEKVSGCPLLLFFASSLCLPSKALYMAIEEKMENFPEIIWSSSKKALDSSHGKDSDVVISNLICLLFLRSPSFEIVDELRKFSRALSIQWLVSMKIDHDNSYDSMGELANLQPIPNILYDKDQSDEENSKRKQSIFNFKPSEISIQIFKEAWGNLSGSEKTLSMMWCKVLAKVSKFMKKHLFWEPREERNEEWHRRVYAPNMASICVFVPLAVEKFLASSSPKNIIDSMVSVNELLDDLNFCGKDSLTSECYTKVASVVTCTMKKFLIHFDPYYDLNLVNSGYGKREIDFDFEDAGSKRVTDFLSETNLCVRLLGRCLEKLGSLCPEIAYENLCEMRDYFDFDLETEISILSSMCCVWLAMTDFKKEGDPFNDLVKIQERCQNLPTQYLILQKVQSLFANSSKAQATLMYPSVVQVVKGIERWMMMGNESTASLRICLGQTLESLIRVDAVNCHNESLDEILIILLRDECFLVRVKAARQIGILFDSWQDHVQLFTTISKSLMLPASQNLIETEDCNQKDDVEEILTSIFALASIAIKSNIVECYSITMICSTLVSCLSCKIIKTYISRVLLKLAESMGYSMSGYLNLFANVLFVHLKPSMLLSENFEQFVSVFLLQDTSFQSSFLSALLGSIDVKYKGRVLELLNLPNYKLESKNMIHAWTLRLIIAHSKSSKKVIIKHLESEKGIESKFKEYENIAMALCTILEGVTCNNSEVASCITVEEGTNLVLALFTFFSRLPELQVKDIESFGDKAFSLAMCKAKHRMDTACLRHRKERICSLHLLANLLEKLKVMWSRSVTYAIGICIESLQSSNMVKEASLALLEVLIKHACSEKNNFISCPGRYAILLHLSSCSRCIEEDQVGCKLLMRMSKIIEFCLRGVEKEWPQSEYWPHAADVDDTLAKSKFKTKFQKFFRKKEHEPLIERVKNFCLRYCKYVGKSWFNCGQMMNDIVAKYLEDLDLDCISLEDVKTLTAGERDLMRSCSLDLLWNSSTLSLKATSNLTKILAFTGPLSSSLVGICLLDDRGESYGSPTKQNSDVASSISRGYSHTSRIAYAVFVLLLSWAYDKEAMLAYESLLSLVQLRHSREANVESRKDICGLISASLWKIWDIEDSGYDNIDFICEDTHRKFHGKKDATASSTDEPRFDENCWSGHNSFEDRLHKITLNIFSFCKSDCLQYCMNVISKNPVICKDILPLLIEDIAFSHSSDSKICKEISSMLERHVFADNSSKLSDLFLTILERLRIMYYSMQNNYSKHPQGKLSWESCYWLDVDYLSVAKLAASREQHFTALLNIEHWYERQYGTLQDFQRHKLPSQGKGSNTYKSLKNIEAMLIDIFQQIGEFDGLYAFATDIGLETQLRIFEHEEKWDKALQTYDILLSSNLNNPERYKRGMANCIKNLGCSHLFNSYVTDSTQERNGELSDEQYARAWHECAWTLPIVDLKNYEKPRLNQSLYNCLYAIKSKDVDFFESSRNALEDFALKSLRVNGKESAATVNKSIIISQMLDHLSKAFEVKAAICESSDFDGKDFKHGSHGVLPMVSFPFQESMLATYGELQVEDRYHLLRPLFKLFASVLKVLDWKEGLQKAYLYEAHVSRKAKDLTQSTANLAVVKQMCKLTTTSKNFQIEVKLEEMRNLWDQGLKTIALNECKKVYNVIESQANGFISYCHFSAASTLLGKWIASSCSESADEISKILEKSVNLAKAAYELKQNDESRFLLCNAHFKLAQFCDSQYRGIMKQLNSTEWLTREKLFEHTDKQLELLASKKGLKNTSNNRDLLHYKVMATRFLQEDMHQAKKFRVSKASFLTLCLTHYAETLITGDLYDIEVVFRLCQLWFQYVRDPGMNSKMGELCSKIPSHKFLCLIYQIGSRLASGGTADFDSQISRLLVRMCFDHPYHTLPHVFAFCNAGRGKDGTERDTKSNTGYAVDKSKVIAAKAILEKVKKRDKESRDRLHELSLIINAYIQLAVLPVKKGGSLPQMHRAIRDLSNLRYVPIITLHMQIDKTCEYGGEHFAHFSHFKSKIELVGGINAPKLLTVIDSNGKEHLQLAKSGNDDLRQDAVMQQLFNLVNHLLRACTKTRKRRLGLKTYNVIPLTPAAGLVEWVRGSIPLSKYLVGDSGSSMGAHRRLRPQDWTYQQCLGLLYKYQNSTPKTKKECFLRICHHFKPVLHHFFLEHYINTADWFQKRLAYTRSIATSSMVGYVVGLGDRHASNILIDEKTAEVLHIDLGIAFEQGKVSKIPETVPFRLTRDIVDGMGISGVEGTMRRCSEEVMEVLRASKEQLLTIVEVFIHDPLYKWALSPVKAVLGQIENHKQQQQNSASHHGNTQSGFEAASEVSNADAERALLKVKEKLEGLEHGERKSIEGQVQQLLREAQDINNLSVMYSGWGPWL